MAQHTPGPWHIDYKPEHRAIVADNGQVVASTQIPGRIMKAANADARLMAAAPDLLEALELAREWLPSRRAMPEEIHDQIDVPAIAKAKGE